MSICTESTRGPREPVLQVLVAARVFLGHRVNLQEKYDCPIWQVDSICRTRSGAQYAALLDPLRLALITAASRPTTQRRQTQSRQTQAAASGMPARMSPGLAASPLIEHDSVLGRVDFADTQPLTDGHLLAAYAVQPRSSG